MKIRSSFLILFAFLFMIAGQGFGKNETPAYFLYVFTGQPIHPTTTNGPGDKNEEKTTVTDSSDCFAEVPTAFSPNDDGQNDRLYVLGGEFKSMQFTIYNRQGVKIFESSDQARGWDGSFNGIKQANDVYYFLLTVECLNGEKIKKKGDVTLVN